MSKSIESKEDLIKTLKQRAKNIRDVCEHPNTLNYLSLEERMAFSTLSYEIDREIRKFQGIIKS